MTFSKEMGIAVAGSAVIALAVGWGWKIVRGWQRKSPGELERLRRLGVNAGGRIIPGRIVEVVEPMADGPAGSILLYDYEVAGVTYEAAQDVSALPEIAAAAPFLSGQTTSVKFDPRQPTNSILACETWCGIPALGPNRNALPERKEEPAGPTSKKTS